MIGRTVLAKVFIFAIVTVLGVGYVGIHYLHWARSLLGEGYTAYVDLPDSGGIFTTASVTYRGIEIGRVGPITLRPDGIRVALDITSGRKIPCDVRAVVGNGSAIGEQFVDLQPVNDHGPYLGHCGHDIPQHMTGLPVSSQTLLVDLDKLVNSVPKPQLRTLVTELGTAFNETGPALQRLLDSTHALLTTASANLPQTTQLLRDSRPVLATQNASSAAIRSFAAHLAALSDQLRTSDGDIRRVIEEGAPAAVQVTGLVHSIDATLPVLLGNLVSLGQVTAVRIPAFRQILIVYPYIIATSFGLFPGNGSTRFGVPVPPDNSVSPCTEGYLPTNQWRLPSALTYRKTIVWNAACRAPTNQNTSVRGAREAPEPNGRRLGDDPTYKNNDGLPKQPGPSPTSGPGTGANPAATVLTEPQGGSYQLASTGGQHAVMGDASWQWLILGPLEG